MIIKIIFPWRLNPGCFVSAKCQPALWHLADKRMNVTRFRFEIVEGGGREGLQGRREREKESDGERNARLFYYLWCTEGSLRAESLSHREAVWSLIRRRIRRSSSPSCAKTQGCARADMSHETKVPIRFGLLNLKGFVSWRWTLMRHVGLSVFTVKDSASHEKFVRSWLRFRPICCWNRRVRSTPRLLWRRLRWVPHQRHSPLCKNSSWR